MHFHTFFYELFNWPNGIVVGNLIASVIWSVVFEWRLRVHRRVQRADHENLLQKVIDKIDGNPVT